MESWPLKIIEALAKELPGVKSHLKMSPPGREMEPAPLFQGQIRQSGVLVLLFPVDGELATCLIKRPVTMKDHAGQIGFPGGKCEPEDANPLQTALRESMEEIGILPGDVEILGALSPLWVPVSRFLIHPFVAWSSTKPDFNPESAEVERLHIFPLSLILFTPQSTFSVVETQKGRLNVPAFVYEGETIWGATAMILSEFADVLGNCSGTD